MVFAPWTMEKITQQWPRGPGQPAEETEEYYKRLCQNMAAMTQLNAWTDIDKIIKAHLASPCRRQKNIGPPAQRLSPRRRRVFDDSGAGCEARGGWGTDAAMRNDGLLQFQGGRWEDDDDDQHGCCAGKER